jgi:hypothetical protein
MRKVLEIGGLVAIVMGMNGRSHVDCPDIGCSLRLLHPLNSIFGLRAPKTVGSTPLPTA